MKGLRTAAAPIVAALALFSVLLVDTGVLAHPSARRVYIESALFRLEGLDPAKSVREPSAGGRVRPTAVTVDLELGDQDHVVDLLRVFRKHGVTATFFVVGELADEFPAHVRLIAQAGHEIASHTQSHPRLDDISAAQGLEDVATSVRTLERLTGRPVLGFRPPYLIDATATIAALSDVGLEYYASDITPKQADALGGALSWCEHAATLSVSEVVATSGPLAGTHDILSDNSLMLHAAFRHADRREALRAIGNALPSSVVIILHPKTAANNEGFVEEWLSVLDAAGARYITMSEMSDRSAAGWRSPGTGR